MKRVAVHTLGCKLNFAETSTIGRQFLERGYHVVEPDQPSDVFILNTCSVTERADRECRSLIRRALRHSPDAYVVVIGCYAQLQPEEIASIEGVDLVLGAKEKFRIFERAGDFQKIGLPQIYVSCIDETVDVAPAYSAEVGNRTRAFLKIQDGCDYTCAFCTIPLARGASRSLPVEHVLGQAKSIAAQGYKEVVLTGVNVGDYGRKIGTSLRNLLTHLESVGGIERIRISSIEPNLVTEELVAQMLASGKICNHFHLPLQSGSDEILKRMRRRYLTNDYRRIINSIRSHDPAAGIGADVIVGFPGETDELFEETYQFLVELPLSYLHVFTYSERPDTAAISFGAPVEPRVRFKRNEMLRILSQKKRQAFSEQFLGRTEPVLFESSSRPGIISGLTTNYLRVEHPAAEIQPNTLCTVRLVSMKDGVIQSERRIPSHLVPASQNSPSALEQVSANSLP